MSEWTNDEPRQVGASGAPSPWQSEWARALSTQSQPYDAGGNANSYDDRNGYAADAGGNGNSYDDGNGYAADTADAWGQPTDTADGWDQPADTTGSWGQPYDDEPDDWETTGYGQYEPYAQPVYGEPTAPPPPSDDPDDDGSRSELRRVLIGGAAGVAMLVGPIVLANVIVPSDDDVDADTTSIAARRNLSEAAGLEDQARVEAAQANTTTTTTLPPTTTTTAPPTTTTTVPPTTTTTAPPVEVPPVENGSGQLGDPNYMPTWDALAECEAGGNWQINTGNGYYGGLQFSLSSWQGVGGQGYPHENSRETQIAMGQRLQASSGWGAWPACTAELGWR